MTAPVDKSSCRATPPERVRTRVQVEGTVQGVGFRPYVYRLARLLTLSGWVENSGRGVTIEVEGDGEHVAEFLRRLPLEIPPQASIASVGHCDAPVRMAADFVIRQSAESGPKTTQVVPDLATCPDCDRDIHDPGNRRFRYPFTNCTNCGPRYSIIEALPYDRSNTSMKHFAMCPACRAEYDDPSDRRFHAQPNACPVCGPHLALWSESGQTLATRDGALTKTAAAIREGQIVAVKGLGGFHLLVDARNDIAVRRLRERKLRAEKPFALMYPTLDAIAEDCVMAPEERSILESAAAPIMLLRTRSERGSAISEMVAPGNPYLGVMRPYTPLHILLLEELGCPVVATSGNRSDEPIVTDERDALRRLHGIADLFLVHDRPIIRPVDDSVVTIMSGREVILRRARGYAPMTMALSRPIPPATAMGAQLKNTVAVGMGTRIWISQHIGDLETPESLDSFRHTKDALARLHEVSPAVAVCDQHPEYISTKEAMAGGLPVHGVQHHHAHILACLADNEAEGPVLGIAWDGTGYGTDQTIWGGEFLEVTGSRFVRRATFLPFRLPGGDAAIREPRRSALGALAVTLGTEWLHHDDLAPVASFAKVESATIQCMLSNGINAPITTSVGRLFDAVASLLGVCQRASFEGQAAMMLEHAIGDTASERTYPFAMIQGADALGAPVLMLDWRPMIIAITRDAGRGGRIGEIASAFHNTLVEMALRVIGRLEAKRVALSGGCFQNRYLTERMIRRLRDSGVEVLWHRRIPPNDGGIAVGQLKALAAMPDVNQTATKGS